MREDVSRFETPLMVAVIVVGMFALFWSSGTLLTFMEMEEAGQSVGVSHVGVLVLVGLVGMVGMLSGGMWILHNSRAKVDNWRFAEIERRIGIRNGGASQ